MIGMSRAIPKLQLRTTRTDTMICVNGEDRMMQQPHRATSDGRTTIERRIQERYELSGKQRCVCNYVFFYNIFVAYLYYLLKYFHKLEASIKYLL